MDIILILCGFVGLILGGELLVRGAVALALRLNVSAAIIGVTLVGFGTSTPELLTSLQAALAGSPGIAVGNVVGSNIANILLIGGIAALLSPMVVARGMLTRDGTTMVLATLIVAGIVVTGQIGRGAGALLLAALAVYLVIAVRGSRGTDPAAELAVGQMGALRSLLLLGGGLALTLLGARLLVTGAVSLAATLGMSEALIGLTIVAVGTSLPELVTTVIAARRGQGELALGNVIGSNIFNLLGILGITALVHPLDVPAVIVALDVWVMLAATLVLAWMCFTGWRLDRREGAALLAGYGAYLGWLVAHA